jgi:hypothetical protein
LATSPPRRALTPGATEPRTTSSLVGVLSAEPGASSTLRADRRCTLRRQRRGARRPTFLYLSTGPKAPRSSRRYHF